MRFLGGKEGLAGIGERGVCEGGRVGPEDVVVVGEGGEEDAEEEADRCVLSLALYTIGLRGLGGNVRPTIRKVAKGLMPLSAMLDALVWLLMARAPVYYSLELRALCDMFWERKGGYRSEECRRRWSDIDPPLWM